MQSVHSRWGNLVLVQQSAHGSNLHDRLAVVLEAVQGLATKGHQPRTILSSDPGGCADAVEQLPDAAVRVGDPVVAEDHVSIVLGTLLLQRAMA